MAILKITKKHKKHFNNPFPSSSASASTTIPYVKGSLFINAKTVPTSDHNLFFPIGNDFKLSCFPNNGVHLSISHLSEPTRPIWSSIPGQAFLSAAMADTEVEESRGSFLVKDRDVHLVCNHQIIDGIKVINDNCQFDHNLEDHEKVSADYSPCDDDAEEKAKKLPILLITGRLFNKTIKIALIFMLDGHLLPSDEHASTHQDKLSQKGKTYPMIFNSNGTSYSIACP